MIAFVAAGHSRRAAAHHDVSPSCVVNLMARLAGITYAARLWVVVGSGKLAAFRGVIIAMIEPPDITLMEMSENLLERFDICRLPGLCIICANSVTAIKKTLVAIERGPDVPENAVFGIRNKS